MHGGAGERRAGGDGESQHHGLGGFDDGVADKRERDEFRGFARCEAERAGGEREIGTGCRGAAGDGIVYRDGGGGGLAECNKHNGGATLGDGAGGGGETHRRLERRDVVIADNEDVLVERGRERGTVGIAQREHDVLVGLGQKIVDEGERDRRRGDAGSEGEHAGHKSVVDPESTRGVSGGSAGVELREGGPALGDEHVAGIAAKVLAHHHAGEAGGRSAGAGDDARHKREVTARREIHKVERVRRRRGDRRTRAGERVGAGGDAKRAGGSDRADVATGDGTKGRAVERDVVKRGGGEGAVSRGAADDETDKDGISQNHRGRRGEGGPRGAIGGLGADEGSAGADDADPARQRGCKLDTAVAGRARRGDDVFDSDGARCGGGERDGHGDRSGGLGDDAADGGEADGGGGHLVVGEVERGGRTARIAAGGEREHDGLGALGQRILRGRHGQIHTGRAGGNRDGAGKRLVIDAVGRGAAHRVVDDERGGGAAGAGEVKFTGGRRALGERGDAVVRRAVGIDEDGGLLIVVQPERRGASGIPKLIRGAGRECDDDGLEVFGERVVDRGDGDVDDIIAAASRESNGAGKRGIVGAGSGGAADGIVDGDSGGGTASQGEAEFTGGGRLAHARERDDLDVGQVAGVDDGDEA